MTTVLEKRGVEFDVDAMLMYGWVSDVDHHVTHVSNSLERWIRSNAVQSDATDAESWQAALEALRRIANDGPPVTVNELVGAVLDPKNESGAAAMITYYMDRLAKELGAPLFERGPVDEIYGEYAVRLQRFEPRDGDPPLLGVRFVRDAATLMRTRRNADRVDIIVVAQMEPDGHGWWRIRGFQGQLQEAWLRVNAKVSDGSRAGGIALMSRNLSHNIGSHALYWIASGADEHMKKFLHYLQGRMELLAGFATSMPLSPVVMNVRDVVLRFAQTKLLLDNICRSEKVTSITIRYLGEATTEAVFFGGELGIHAFYSMLENCVRDSSKFAATPGTLSALQLTVAVREVDKLVQVDVYDDRGNYETAAPGIARALSALRLVDDAGRLNNEHWGIKERFVCAAMLRGRRPEDFRLDSTELAGTAPPQRLRTLSIVNVGGNCAWRFFLPRRMADVLLVTNSEVLNGDKNVLIETHEQFEKEAQSTTGISARFVVIDHPPAPIEPRGPLIAALPFRTFILGDAGESGLPALSEDPAAISTELLLQRSVERLARTPYRLVISPGEPEQAGPLEFGVTHEDIRLDIVPNVWSEFLEAVLQIHHAEPLSRLLVVRRHNVPPEFWETAHKYGIEHFEWYRQGALQRAVINIATDRNFAAYRLVEAALTKILIVDERLDLMLRDDPLRRRKLRLRGIKVQGGDFAGHMSSEHPVSVDQLGSWGSGFHFVLLHRGVIDKLIQRENVTTETIVSTIESYGARVIVHSGRMGMKDMPPWTKFLSLANVNTWIDQDFSKIQIMDELFSLRRV